MAANPMQRKTRLAFILGMLVAILIGAVIIMVLLTQIKKVKQEKADVEASMPKQEMVWVATQRIEEGEEAFRLEEGSFVDVQQKMVYVGARPDNAITDEVIYSMDEEDGEDGEDESEEGVNYFRAKITIEPGTIITESMLEKNPKASESMRLIEYNMLSLPSKLEVGQYIDIRIVMPDGADFVVLSKKYVADANSSTVWLKLSEKDMVTLNTAIIESYMIEGSKIYATVFSDSTQQKLSTTYVPSGNVNTLIQANSIDVAENQNVREFIESYVNRKGADERTSAVQSGFSAEQQKMKSQREAFLGEIGY